MKNRWEKYGSQKINGSNRNLIEIIENLSNLKLPIDYENFFTNYSGFESFIGEEYVVIWEPKQVSKHNIEYEVFDNLDQTLAIGSNGSGELIAIEQVKNRDCRIILTPNILDKNAHIIIGESFTDLFIRLESNSNWF